MLQHYFIEVYHDHIPIVREWESQEILTPGPTPLPRLLGSPRAPTLTIPVLSLGPSIVLQSHLDRFQVSVHGNIHARDGSEHLRNRYQTLNSYLLNLMIETNQIFGDVILCVEVRNSLEAVFPETNRARVTAIV